MATLSLRRAVAFGRYHYTALWRQYLTLFLEIMAVPLIFSLLSDSVVNGVEASLVVYLFCGLGIAKCNTYLMRDRGTRYIAAALPVSAEEQMLFMLFNSAVVMPLLFVVASLSVLLIGLVTFEDTFGAGYVLTLFFDEVFLRWPLYLFVQITAAGALLINLLARRSLLMSYVVAFVAVVLLLWGLVEILTASPLPFNPVRDTEYIAEVAMTLYCLVPVILYALCYVVLRCRQMKW